MSEKTFKQEEVRYFLETMGSDMRERYNANLPAALTLFDAIMEPGPRCEASKEVFRQWFNNLFRFSVVDVVLDKGRTFVGVDIIRPVEPDNTEEDDKKKPERLGFYG